MAITVKLKEFDMETKKEVWELYFKEMYSMGELKNHFKGKLLEVEIRRIINEKYRSAR